jgi:hypothetical protein
MYYLSLGSQPVVSQVLSACGLNTDPTVFDNVGDLSFSTLLKCIETNFSDFFPPKSELKKLDGVVNIVNGNPSYVVRDERNGTLFYDSFPVGKQIDAMYPSVKQTYERLSTKFVNTLKNESPIVFIRQMMDDNDNDTVELADLLRWMYPALKFYVKHRYAGREPSKCYGYWKGDLCRGN